MKTIVSIREPWHWRMAVATAALALFGVWLIATGANTHPQPGADDISLAYELYGALVITACLAAAYVSSFWNSVAHLDQPKKAFVWGVAIAGSVVFVLIWIAWQLWLSYNRQRD